MCFLEGSTLNVMWKKQRGCRRAEGFVCTNPCPLPEKDCLFSNVIKEFDLLAEMVDEATASDSTVVFTQP